MNLEQVKYNACKTIVGIAWLIMAIFTIDYALKKTEINEMNAHNEMAKTNIYAKKYSLHNVD